MGLAFFTTSFGLPPALGGGGKSPSPGHTFPVGCATGGGGVPEIFMFPIALPCRNRPFP